MTVLLKLLRGVLTTNVAAFPPYVIVPIQQQAISQQQQWRRIPEMMNTAPTWIRNNDTAAEVRKYGVRITTMCIVGEIEQWYHVQCVYGT